MAVLKVAVVITPCSRSFSVSAFSTVSTMWRESMVLTCAAKENTSV